MKLLVAVLFLLVAVKSYAGTAKLTWSHNYQAADGSPAVPTHWRVYWGLEGQQLNNPIQISPLGTPWKTENGLRTFSMTMAKPEWLPGQRICFQMTAWLGDLESPRSGIACKTMEQNPTNPNLIKAE